MIELKGPILRSDLDRVLAEVTHTRGVSQIDDDLEVHEHADIPALQGATTWRSKNVLGTPAVRLVFGAAAASLTVSSLLRGNPVGLLAGGAIVVGLARSIAHRGAPRVFQRATAGGGVRGLREAYPLGSEWAPT